MGVVVYMYPVCTSKINDARPSAKSAAIIGARSWFSYTDHVIIIMHSVFISLQRTHYRYNVTRTTRKQFRMSPGDAVHKAINMNITSTKLLIPGCLSIRAVGRDQNFLPSGLRVCMTDTLSYAHTKYKKQKAKIVGNRKAMHR